ncbi:MAG: universal stress protein [Thermomicrobium sp.]|nr:universal stress protein [Thermomicrobium sp.]MCS7246486.1 universal stress protein [Thermomicrobium sp.]MDW7982766.1 universal stress protein [Thermomicrobium sp.]MDW8060964.1 universal stress protein [Thermomicrobium sp.]
MGGPIVVPVLPTYLDPERVTHCALPFGRAMAQQLGVELVLLSVVEVTESLRSYLEAEGEQVEQLIRRWLQQRREAIVRLAETVRDVSTRVEVVLGEPAKAILAFAEGERAAAIAMSSHGRLGVTRLLVGSVTFNVVQHARLPVLVVRAGIPIPPPNAPVSLSPILVPLDGSPLAEEAIETALTLLGRHEPPALHLFHVLTDREEPTRWERYLADIAQRLQERGYRTTWSLGQGSVAEAIAEEASRRRAGLIAMGTHGASGIRRVLLGSTAEHVLHTTTVPLLLHRPRAVSAAIEEPSLESGPLRVRDIMTANPITVDPDTTLEQVAKLMLEHQIGAVPVVDAEGRLLGLIREEDFLARERPIPFSALRAPQLFGRWIDAETIDRIYAEARRLKAGEVARTPEVTVTEDTTLGALAERMVAANVRHVPVLREGKLVGIVTRHDVLKAVAHRPSARSEEDRSGASSR